MGKRVPKYTRGQSIFHKADGAHGVIEEVYEQLGAHFYYVYSVSWSSDDASLVKEHLLAGSMAELDEAALDVESDTAEGDEA
jgi:hypothetical protein